MEGPSIHNKIEELERQVKSLMARVTCNQSRGPACDFGNEWPTRLQAFDEEQVRSLPPAGIADDQVSTEPETRHDGSHWGDILSNVSCFVTC